MEQIQTWKNWIERAQNGDTEYMSEILKTIHPKIKKSLNQTGYKDQEDLEQYLIEKILIIVMKYDTDNIPGFWKFKRQWDENRKDEINGP